MITLKEFIKGTLTQISEAVVEFGSEKGETGANANPPLIHGDGTTQRGLLQGQFDERKARHETIMPVEFDVAVSAEESEAKGGGAGVRVLSFIQADGKVEKETASSSVSRVRFNIPLRLPDTGAHGQRRQPPRVIPDPGYND